MKANQSFPLSLAANQPHPGQSGPVASSDQRRDAYERAPVACLALAGDGTVLQANIAAAELLECDRPQLIGRDFASCVDIGCHDVWERHIQAALSADVKQTCELTLRQRSGGKIYCRLESICVTDRPRPGGGPAATVASGLRTCVVDLSDMKRAQEELLRRQELVEQKMAEQVAALQSSQDWIRSLLGAAGDAIITIDRKGVISDANPACERIFGFPAGYLVGRPLDLLLPQAFDAADLPASLTQLLDAAAGRDPERSIRQWMARRSSGDTLPVELTVTEIDHQQIFLVIIRDVTGRKELERQVLDASSGEQRRIAQDLHDELGQELTGLRYMALNLVEALATQEGDLDEQDVAAALAQRIASGIATAQQHLRGAIRGIMPVDVDAEGLEAALRGLAERTNRYGKTICRFLCNNPVPLEDNAVATQLYRIAQEAVTNAVKHGQAHHIQIRLESDAESITLSVADDGPGIDIASSFSAGWGLRIMQYRAGLIGAELKVLRKQPRGTVILCSLLARR